MLFIVFFFIKRRWVIKVIRVVVIFFIIFSQTLCLEVYIFSILVRFRLLIIGLWVKNDVIWSSFTLIVILSVYQRLKLCFHIFLHVFIGGFFSLDRWFSKRVCLNSPLLFFHMINLRIIPLFLNRPQGRQEQMRINNLFRFFRFILVFSSLMHYKYWCLALMLGRLSSWFLWQFNDLLNATLEIDRSHSFTLFSFIHINCLLLGLVRPITDLHWLYLFLVFLLISLSFLARRWI